MQVVYGTRETSGGSCSSPRTTIWPYKCGIVVNVATVNNHSVIDWCLFGRFAEESNKNISMSSIYANCNNGCNKLYIGADYTVRSAPDSYNSCDSAGNFTKDAESCLDCLYETPGLTMLGNGKFNVLVISYSH
jgi:hypothetical protein